MRDEEKIQDYAQTTIKQGEESLRGAISEAQKRLKEGREQVTKMATDVDKQAHENPWPIIAGVGVGCLLLGLLIGKSKN